MFSRSAVRVGLAALFLVVAPVLALALLRMRTEDRLAAVDLTPDPVVVTAEETVTDGRRGVTLVPSWTDPPTLLAPPWSGLVTGVKVDLGDAITSGRVVLEIDGVDRLAAVTARPFHRSLSRNATGDDVVMLQELLSELGAYAGSIDGRYGSTMVTSVQSWAVSLGLVRPQGVFDPAWLVWLPQSGFVVAEVHVSVGAPATQPGAPIVSGRPLIHTLRMEDQEGVEVDLTGEWIVTVDKTELSLLDGRFDIEALMLLAEMITPSSEHIAASVRLAEPLTVVMLPAAAIVSNSDGQLCVWLDTGGSYRASTVQLAGGHVALVEVAVGIQPGDRVLINPADIIAEPSCP